MVTARGLLTRGYAKLTCGGIQSTEAYTAQGIEEQVYWVDTDGWMSGQYTPLGTILLNKSRFRERSDDLNEYVFLHEIGHSRMHIVPNILLGLIRMVAAALLISLPFSPLVYIPIVRNTSVSQLPIVALAFLVTGMLIILPHVITSWLDEGYAEYFALSILGPDEYLRRRRELRDNWKSGLLKRVWISLTYPHPKLVHWVARRL